MSATIRAAAALLDASYQVEDTAKADIWREMAVEARQEYDLLRAERDKAQANYRFMVERAADEKLDGYRELGARAAAAENERDEALAELARMKARPAEAEYASLDVMWQQLVRERDSWKSAAESQNRQWSQKCTEGTELRADFERIHWEQREALRSAHEALANVIRECGRICTRESYCGPCGAAYAGLPEDYKL